jgi:hypothetical protein
MFANSSLGGMSFTFPDICKTPAPPLPFIPIPYPNWSFHIMATGFVPKVLWMCSPAHVIARTQVPISFGDTPGVLGGIISQSFMSTTYFLTGAFTVLLQGLPATRMTSITLMNRCNMIGISIVPSQFKVLLLAA